jgi:hypothetical protein
MNGHPENNQEVLQELERITEKQGSLLNLAKRSGVNYQFLRGVRCGTYNLTQKVAKKLGYKLMWVKEK